MKKYYFFLITLLFFEGYSQNFEMQSYKFGDGLRFVGDNGQSIRLTGYAQPIVEIKETENQDQSSSKPGSNIASC